MQSPWHEHRWLSSGYSHRIGGDCCFRGFLPTPEAHFRRTATVSACPRRAGVLAHIRTVPNERASGCSSSKSMLLLWGLRAFQRSPWSVISPVLEAREGKDPDFGEIFQTLDGISKRHKGQSDSVLLLVYRVAEKFCATLVSVRSDFNFRNRIAPKVANVFGIGPCCCADGRIDGEPLID